MKERPILFSAPMVCAILDGTKTQTRRVVKSRPDKNMGPRCVLLPHELAGEVNSGDYTNCPYGMPGDSLWVRETFLRLPVGTFYRATHNGTADEDKAHGIIWKPSIHMPRWASRITLKLTGVRVEQLNDITEADAIAEGASFHDGRGIGHSGYRHDRNDGFVFETAKASYMHLWEKINGAGSWSANPRVWVIEFEVIK